MRRRITWRSAAAISMLGLAPAIGAAFAAPAGASTNDCLAAYGTQCGTFTESPASADGASGGLGWAVKGQSSASNTPLIEYKNYSPGTDPGTDLTKVEHYGQIPGSPSASPGIWYSIVYTPSGQWTSMCVANPDNKGRGGTNLVLRSCNQQVWQAFMAVAPTPCRGCRRRPKASLPTTTPPPNVLPPAPSAPTPWRGSVVIHNEQQRHRLRPVQRGERQVCRGRPLLHVCRRSPAAAPAPRGGLFPPPAAPVTRSTATTTPTRGSGRTPTAPAPAVELAVN